MKNIIKKYYEVLLSDVNTFRDNYVSKMIVSVVFCFAAILMLVLNIYNKQYLMTICSIILVVGFFMSFLAAFITKKSKISKIIIFLLVAFILSIFAISGGNEGFAVLWILLVPIMAINLLGIWSGILISTYFLIFILVLFYTPLKEYVSDNYSVKFMNRFPILYLSDYVISLILSLQKEYYFRIIHIKSYVDELTGVYNRRYFIENIVSNGKNHRKPFGIMVIDVNGLKVINDSLGHKFGDELIKSVPECFKKVFGNDIELCRIGGDEYALLMEDNKKNVEKKIKEVKKIAKEWKHEQIKELSFSVGYASTDMFDTDDVNTLFMKADELMYEDKNKFYKLKDRRRK